MSDVPTLSGDMVSDTGLDTALGVAGGDFPDELTPTLETKTESVLNLESIERSNSPIL
ncbi:MAG: hypothetical protein WBG66_09250 [Geitlerinemataceae cyanobacterium]